MVCGQGFELAAALAERGRAEIEAVFFEEVVGHELNGHIGEELFRERLAGDALLQVEEREGAIVFERQDLAIEDDAIGEGAVEVGDFGEAVGEEIFAAGPEEEFAAPSDELAADTVPFPFDLPLR